MINVIGGGLAGCEAAWQIAEAGCEVTLREMRPTVSTAAHRTDKLAELVCSTSLKSDDVGTAHGILKREMRTLGSLLLRCADEVRVPGGGALCVDPERFSSLVTERTESHPNITVVREEVKTIPEGITVIATGPLTSPSMAEEAARLTGAERLRFFDAIAPTVYLDSIDFNKVFRQSRYDKGEDDYINAPMTAEKYNDFIDNLLTAEIADLHLEEEKAVYFEGCMPIEVMASRGRDTLSYGPMKPVGLTDPHTGKRPHAVVQLRQENAEGTLWGLVGFQTQMKIGEQKRIFRMIPGLENAEFARFGSVHRNTYIKSPGILEPTFKLKGGKPLFFAGQMTGVEGYMESAASGIIAGINAARYEKGQPLLTPPRETMIGSLAHHVAFCEEKVFAPMNSNFGILPEIPYKHRMRMRKELKAKAAEEAMKLFVSETL
ncbi:MAG: methylenetetrahydrofolate--tRNA-(uracil(54)-C(5))-methyltransferase (FADH(2)-oxidizing) TrmFO [Abditibacteriota bacterium]|nr:methylenetetrahydrofolate--tRNA-(uracil(54)-C(5))-methyltransferase (FADH(2)-oxidizing) TrmFO [Abditibacteriota bacterium]